jgi:hypothetical protein
LTCAHDSTPLLDVDEDRLVWQKGVDGLCKFGRMDVSLNIALSELTSAVGHERKAHVEHNKSALTLIADIPGAMDFRREGPKGDC